MRNTQKQLSTTTIGTSIHRPSLGYRVCLATMACVLAFGLTPFTALPAYAQSSSDAAEPSYLPDTFAAPVDEAPLTEEDADGVLIVVDEDAIEGQPDLSALSVEDLATSDASLTTDTQNTLEETGLNVTSEQLTSQGMLVTAELTEDQSIEQAVEAAQALPEVTYAQPNYVYEPIIETTASSAQAQASNASATAIEALAQYNDPYARISSPDALPNQYWLYATKLASAWNTAISNHGITVAVLDSGVQLDHEDLQSNILSDLAFNVVDNKPITSSNTFNGDITGHGTHVAGIISGIANNGIGVAGGSYNANVLPVAVYSASDNHLSATAILVAAYDYLFKLIDEGLCDSLRVINMSLRITNLSQMDPLVANAITRAKNDYGIVTVCAGGNSGGSGLTFPADYEDCVAVTALDADGNTSAISDYNQYKDISAPGESIFSTTSSRYSNDTYGVLSGTSMAAPMVSAACALLFSAAPEATVDEVLDALYSTATPINTEKNNRGPALGSHGALDVEAAIQKLLENSANSIPFSDVSPTSWFYQAVQYAAQRGIMNGIGGTAGMPAAIFAPNNTITRAEAAQVLYNYLHDGSPVTTSANFSDIDHKAWYIPALNWAVANNYMQGYEGTKRFGPNDPITREQLAVLLSHVTNLIDSVGVDQQDSSDFFKLQNCESTSTWALASMIWAVDNGLIQGISGIDLAPTEYLSRAQMAMIIMRAIKNQIL